MIGSIIILGIVEEQAFGLNSLIFLGAKQKDQLALFSILSPFFYILNSKRPRHFRRGLLEFQLLHQSL